MWERDQVDQQKRHQSSLRTEQRTEPVSELFGKRIYKQPSPNKRIQVRPSDLCVGHLFRAFDHLRASERDGQVRHQRVQQQHPAYQTKVHASYQL